MVTKFALSTSWIISPAKLQNFITFWLRGFAPHGRNCTPSVYSTRLFLFIFLRSSNWLQPRPMCRYNDQCVKTVVFAQDSAMRDLFTKIQSPEHCLHPLLPPKRRRSNRHRPKGHDYELPDCTYNFHKQSYVINFLFKFCNRFNLHVSTLYCAYTFVICF